MSFRERRERAAAVKNEMQAERKRLGAALRAMDYTRALACQMELDRLQIEARLLARQNGHEPYPTPDEIGQQLTD